MDETQRFQAAAEEDHLLGKRAPKVSGVTTGVEAAKVAVQFAFREPNAGLVSDDQWSIHGGHRTPVSGFSLNPVQNLVHTLQTGNITKVQCRTIQHEGGQTAWLSIPTKVYPDEYIHDSWINSTGSPTDMRPGPT